jgi:protein tyrosine/serine phosphatase
MNKIRSNIYLGNSQDAKNFKLLKEMGVTAIINCAIDLDSPKSTDFVQVKYGLLDGPGNSTEALLCALQALDKLVQANSTVLVHCHVGMSRSAIVVAKYLSLKEAKLIENCIQELIFIRPIVNPHKALIDLAGTINEI